MLYFGGIDAGKNGGWAILDQDASIYSINIFECFKCFKDQCALDTFKELFVVLEEVNAFPGQGVTSMFNFGQSLGAWKATLELLEISHELARPQKWQKNILGSFPKGESKIRALAFAQRRWPTLNLKKKDHGIVDALCIALYAKNLYLGKNEKI